MTGNLTPALVERLDAVAVAAPPLPRDTIDTLAGVLAEPVAVAA